MSQLLPFIPATVITLSLFLASLIGGSILCALKVLVYLVGGRLSWLIVPFFSSIFRNVPIVVFLVFSQFILPTVFKVQFSSFYSAILVVSFVVSAYVFDLVRGYFLGFDEQQIDAARVLGFSRFQIVFVIIAPQFFSTQKENLISVGLIALKATAIASVISVQEITHTANRIISQTAQPTVPILVSTSLYLVLGVAIYFFISIFLGRKNG